ncbi:hypothetical protein MBH78_17120 [Oceanimonas sp. NS1]|nr:hypothetical protein [Oceanimonas sp. NS1]
MTTGLLLLLCVLILNSVVNHFFETDCRRRRAEAATVLQAEISQQLSSQAATAGTRLAAFINDSFRTP